MIPFRKSIGFRLLCISFILLAFPLLVDAFILVQRKYARAIADAKGYLVEIAHARELPLTQIKPVEKPLLNVVTYFLNLQADFPEEPSEALNKKLTEIAQIGGIWGIFLVKITEDNQYIIVSSNLPGFTKTNYTDFYRLSKPFGLEDIERGFSSYVSYDIKSQEPFFVMIHPVYVLGQERAVGLLAVSRNISEPLKKLLAEDDYHYPVKFAFLLPSTVVFAAGDPKLRFQYFRPLSEEYRHLFLEQEPLAIDHFPDAPLVVNDSIGYPFFEFEWDGQTQIGYVKKLPDSSFTLLTYASKEAVFRAPTRNFFNVYSIYGSILLIGGSIAYFLTKRMAKPIRRLSSVMQGIQQGNLNLRYEKDPWGFEINLLGHVFNEMVDAVLKQKKIAEEERVKRETFARELRLGQQAQRSLLPQKMPNYPGIDLAEIYIPAIEVGGDFYDVFVKEKSPQLFVAVADASGKGVQACFYSLSMRNILRICAEEYEDVGMAMSVANNLFGSNMEETGMFVTVFMGMYDHKTKAFHYFSAGHNPAILRRKNGDIEILAHHGIAMGVLLTQNQYAEIVQLEEGDTVVLYTDGITEAHNKQFQLYGEKQLISFIKKEGQKSASELVEGIVQQVNNFAEGAPQHDDITLLVMKIR